MISPVQIKKQNWAEETVPKVSIISWVYNHEKFIRDAIESFLLQKTTFPVEIILHDDASSDLSVEIMREYSKKYPKVFRNIFRKKNLWSKKLNPSAEIYNFARGEFIALCDGDDYWINNMKIQIQAEYLQANPRVSIVCTKYLEKHGEVLKKPSVKFNKIINKDNWASPYSLKTGTAMFRKDDLLSVFPQKLPEHFKDIFLWRLLLEKGEAHVLSEVSAVYRLHQEGVWSQKNEFERCIMNLETSLSMLRYFQKQDKDVRNFFRACFKECFKKINQAEKQDLIKLIKISLLTNKIFAPKILFYFIKKVLNNKTALFSIDNIK